MKAFFLRYILRFTFLTSVLLAIETKAYSWDTSVHFYTTYALARYVGIGHEVAVNLAINAEWVDYSKFSSPMGGLIVGTHLRRLFHFVTTYRVTPGEIRSHGRIPGFLGISDPLEPLGVEMFIKGLMENDIEMIGMGLHTMEDLTGHAGFSPTGGHAEFGHHPDRLHVYPERFEHMITMVTRALEVVRDRLPPEAIDHKFRDFMVNDGMGMPHAQLSADELAKRFLAREDVQAARQNILQDPVYIEFAIRELFMIAQKRKFILPEVKIEEVLPPHQYLQSSEPVDVVIKKWWSELFVMQSEGKGKFFDMKLVANTFLNGFGLLSGYVTYEELSPEHKKILSDRVFSQLLQHYIPSELGANQWVQFEIEGPIRQKEVELVNGRFQKIIKNLFGGDILQFTHSTKEFYEKRSASVECVGKCSLWERLRFNWKMLKYIVRLRLKPQFDFNLVWLYPGHWKKFWQAFNEERRAEGKPIGDYLVSAEWIKAERTRIDAARLERKAAACDGTFQ
jgi:hypothetical protein